MLEYVEFKNIKLVEKLQQLKCPQVVKVMAVNRFGPDSLEMVSIPIFNDQYILVIFLRDILMNILNKKYSNSFWSSRLIINILYLIY